MGKITVEKVYFTIWGVFHEHEDWGRVRIATASNQEAAEHVAKLYRDPNSPLGFTYYLCCYEKEDRTLKSEYPLNFTPEEVHALLKLPKNEAPFSCYEINESNVNIFDGRILEESYQIDLQKYDYLLELHK